MLFQERMRFGVILAFACFVHLAFSAKLNGIAQLCRLKLNSPENGKIKEFQEAKPGEFSATFECSPGYRMVGEERIKCKDGNWKSRVPWCKSLCNFKACNQGMKCIVSQDTNDAQCVCKSIFECPFEYKPICGSDHVTYASSCIMGMASCKRGAEVTKISDGICPKGLFDDASCGECPKIRICQALYRSHYAFLGKLKNLNETSTGTYLTFEKLEVYKFGAEETQSRLITLFKKKDLSDCSCVPFVPSGKAYVFGKTDIDSTNAAVNLFDEQTYVEQFYSHNQMSLCWLV